MKKIALIVIVSLSIQMYAQTPPIEVVKPNTSPFQLGGNIEGVAQAAINEVTGKLAFSVPITAISARTLSFPVNLSYNGTLAYDQGQQINKYAPTGIIGVGFGFQIPRIVADHKGTATRTDDDFYLVDGSNNTRLICTAGGGTNTLHFEMEKYAPFKIRFEKNNDRWVLVNGQGVTYYYGDSSNQREDMIAWGNWIGDSKSYSGAGYHTIAWNLAKMEDQWGNNLIFTYDRVQQKINPSSSVTHTEAVYPKQITASTGGKIVFTYGNKLISEYYEPHIEQAEPDAYQERFETKYMQSVKTYDFDGQLQYTHELNHDIKYIDPDDSKRYLVSIVQKDKNGVGLPPQEFEYHYSGTFKGGLKKVTYPTGGIVEYVHQQNLVFNNSANRYASSPPSTTGYVFHGSHIRDNYTLRLYRSNNTISGNKYRYKIIRNWWNGHQWESHEFVFPHLLSDEHLEGKVMDQFLSTFEEDHYAFVYFERTSAVYDKASLYLFQLSDAGEWLQHTYTGITAEADDNKTEDPVLLSGDDFVALATHRTGRVHTYVKRGSNWNYKQIQQGAGQYYFGAANNYILTLDDDGGNDMVTGLNHPDNYYVHYLDAERNWQTKSWSADMDALTYVNDANGQSYIYPNNGMAGIMLHNSPELFIRWDKDFNFLAADNIIGGYADILELSPSMGSMFTLLTDFYKSPIKTSRFIGSGWITKDLSPPSGKTVHGKDMLFMFNRQPNQNGKVSYASFDPNSNTWNENVFSHSNDVGFKPYARVAYNQDFVVLGNQLGVLNNRASIFDNLVSLPGLNHQAFSNTLNYSFVNISDATGNASTGYFYSIDKKTGSLGSVDLGNKGTRVHEGASKFGGYQSNTYLGGNSLLLANSNGGFSLYRIIDDKVNNTYYNNVISEIVLTDGKNVPRKRQLFYSLPHSSPDGSICYYAKVTVHENIGENGKTVKYFKVGDNDLQEVALPYKVEVIDKDGLLVQETETEWKKITINYINSSYSPIGTGYTWVPEKVNERLTLTGGTLETETSNQYNALGQLTHSSTYNSLGQVENTYIKYAHQQYSFVKDRNMMSLPYETKKVVNGTAVSMERSIWKLDEGKAYAYKSTSGINANLLRTDSEITKVDDFGNVLESNNGLGVYKTSLFGYGNLFPIASISNAKFDDVINELDVSYAQLQNLDNTLESELEYLFTRLPRAMVNIELYNGQGRIVKTLDERKESVMFHYDSFGRLEYITDSNNKVLEKKEYNYAE